MNIEIKIINKDFYRVDKIHESYYDLPDYQTFGSAAMDLKVTENVTLMPGDVALINTGLAIHIKDKYVAGVINCRSGFGHKKGLVLGNIQGWIDSDYIDEIKISLWNRNKDEIINLEAGDRIAQIAFFKIEKPEWNVVEEFSTKTSRSGGLGSTGVK